MYHILIIDDEPALRNLIRMVLENVGYQVSEAENGKLGVAAAVANPPDVVLCDIRMPEMNGFEVLENVRKFPATATTPFVFITGEHQEKAMRKGMELGANDFITKPFDAQTLLNALQVRLDQIAKMREQSQAELHQLRSNITLALPHELRTPLTGLLGLAEIFKTDIATMTPSDAQEMAAMLYNSAKRLHHTLEKFWAYSQSELLRSDPESTRQLVSVTTQHADDLIRWEATEQAAAFGRTTDIVVNTVPLTLHVGQQYLKRLVGELIENAFKFSASGTPVNVTATLKDATATLTIQDSGRGMNNEQIRAVSAFTQFDRSKNEQQGIGLGLTIVRNLVHVHQGTISIQSRPDVETTVIVALPAEPSNV